MDYVTINPVNLHNLARVAEIKKFLSGYDLAFDADIDYCLVAMKGNQIIGTCSKSGKVIKCLAVSKAYRGEGLSADLVKMIIDRLFDEGHPHYFVFTQPEKTDLFENLNFKSIYAGEKVALLEGGITSIKGQLDKLSSEIKTTPSLKRIALVMNCNPFTLGHLHLVEKAASTGKEVLLFVVEEDRSSFHFSDRMAMVREGTKHLGNVTVLPGSDYIISQATFPSYFIRKTDERTAAFMEMDAAIFSLYFSQWFDIGTRYVGEEPFCQVTRLYNAVLERVLSTYNITLVKIPRLVIGDDAVSASRVRRYLREGQSEAIKTLVPKSTWQFILETSKGKEAVARICKNDTPH
jgi:[citrate (pro-3S)-lyase] ligase